MIDMAKKEIIPAVEKYVTDLASTALKKQKLDCSISSKYETTVASKLSELQETMFDKTQELEKAVADLSEISDIKEQGYFVRDELLPKMEMLRSPADEAETLTDSKYWPFPTYGDLLFGVR